MPVHCICPQGYVHFTPIFSGPLIIPFEPSPRVCPKTRFLSAPIRPQCGSFCPLPGQGRLQNGVFVRSAGRRSKNQKFSSHTTTPQDRTADLPQANFAVPAPPTGPFCPLQGDADPQIYTFVRSFGTCTTGQNPYFCPLTDTVLASKTQNLSAPRRTVPKG